VSIRDVVQDENEMKRSEKNISCATFFSFLVLFSLASSQGAEQSEENLQKELESINKSIVAIETRLADQIQPRVEKCKLVGYYRQLAWWELNEQQLTEERDVLILRKEILQQRLAGKATPKEKARRLQEVEKERESRKAEVEAAGAKETWRTISRELTDISPKYSWHLVRLSLLRELIHDSRRIRFYIQEAVRPVEGGYGNVPLPGPEYQKRLAGLMVKDAPAGFDLGPVLGVQYVGKTHGTAYRIKHSFEARHHRLVERSREWAKQYGECFFGLQEQQLLEQGEKANGLLKRTQSLVQRVDRLDQDREVLTRELLEFLAHFDKDGRFRSLSLPLRKPVKIDPDGRTSDLLLCLPSGSREQMDPLCFDVTDHVFYGVPFKAPGVVDTGGPAVHNGKTFLDNKRQEAEEDARQGYYLKQPVVLMASYSTVSPKLLPEDMRNDKDLYLCNSAGNYSDRLPNIWHEAVRNLTQDSMTALGRYCRTLPNFLFYDKVTWEQYEGLSVASASSKAVEGGYNPQAITAFRDYLKTKFRDIKKLNTSWRTNYKDFNEIEPPQDPHVTVRRRATPLSYEFESFRAQSRTDYFALVVEAIHKGDPGRPVGMEINTLGDDYTAATVGSFQQMLQIPATYVESHFNNWLAGYTSLNLLYSFCLYANKIPIQTEHIWTYPRLQHPVTEDEFRVTGELSIWRNMVWGRMILNVFGVFDGWGYRHNFMDERYSCMLGDTLGPTGTFVREAGTSIPVAKQRARKFWPYLKSTRVVKPKIALVVPTVSMVNEYPHHLIHDALPTTVTDLFRFERFLTPRELDFRFVPEEVVVNGLEDLSGMEAVILPYAPSFPKGLAEKLLAWTRKGGTLIASGVPGIYDPYGFDDRELMEEVFGSRLEYLYAGDDHNWRWELRPAREQSAVRVLVADSERAVVISTSYGAGRVLLLSESFSASSSKRRIETALADTLEDAIGWPTAFSDHHSFEMVTREDDRGTRYLFIINPDLNAVKTDYVTVDGEYNQVIDLGIGPHCAIPLVPRKPMNVNSRYDITSMHTDGTTFIAVRSAPGRTTFQMRLSPGEGTALKLVK
jgi:hypothetical protein